MKLAAYVLKVVGVRILGAALVLLAVLQILDLLEVTPEIVERGLGFAGILHYAVLRLPRLIDQAAPLAVLSGGIFAFIKLAGESEVVAMRASGVSTYRLLAMALPAALAVMAVDIVAVEVSPHAPIRPCRPGGPPPPRRRPSGSPSPRPSGSGATWWWRRQATSAAGR
jgi:lipopolysaccharide export system permease protein